MQIGIVGKPSSGKSSFLNALTKSSIAKIGNYPFTTLKPNVGVGFAFLPCVCKEMKVNCGQCINELRPIPIKVIDVAGLVPDASKGKGMGNQFLSDLGPADLLIHIVDSSGSLNEEGEDVDAGSHDPIKDIEFLETEIVYWINGIIAKDWDKARRVARSNKTPIIDILADRLSGLKISKFQIRKVLTAKTNIFTTNIQEWDENVLLQFSKDIRELAKPIMIILNKIDKKTSYNHFLNIKSKYPDQEIFPASALAETFLQNFDKNEKIKYDPLNSTFEIIDLSDKEKASILKIKSEILDKYDSTGVNNVLTKAVKSLNYITAFPVADGSRLTDQDGRILPDVHLIPEGTTVKELAGRIHKDLADNFICGIDVRSNKRLSDSYELKDKDIIKIMASN